MTRLFLLLPLIFVISGCTNPYSQYYTDFAGGESIVNNPKYIISTDEPKLIHGSDIAIEAKKMMEDGYVALGCSSFNAGEINQNDALKHAKKVNACIVIIYCNYTHTVSGIMPMTVPNTQTSYHSGSVYGSGGGFANYSGTSTTYGSTTTYMPYSIARYDYYADFWGKITPPRLGIRWDNIPDELQKQIESNKGVYVFVVVKGSPAFDSDLLSGDVIRRINGQEIIDSVHFQELFDKVSDPVIELEIFRNGKNIKKKVQLRS
jgi:hypothetical protein